MKIEVCDGREIKDHQFEGCRILHVTIPSTVTVIGNCALADCEPLREVTLPKGLKIIRSKAFYRCTSMTSINIPSMVTLIGDKAFAGYKQLDRVENCKGLETIGKLRVMGVSS